MKRCTKCNVEKPLTDFHRDSRSKTGKASRCRACTASAPSWYQRSPKHKEVTNQRAQAWRKTNRTRVQKLEKIRYDENPAKTFERNLQRRLKSRNLSRTKWVELLVLQQNSCAICRASFCSESEPHIDHDHRTNQVRGLLCKKCNRGLGLFGDNLLGILKVVTYFQNPPVLSPSQ